jgi:hypothetical protein
MTWLGKILVLMNLVFCAVILGWATQLYLNRVDWIAELKKRDDRLNQMGTALQTAELRFQTNRRLYLERERIWQDNRQWYPTQLTLARTGLGGKTQVSITTVSTSEDGVTLLDPKFPGRPQMKTAKDRTGKDLYTEAYYLAQLMQNHKDVSLQQERFEKAVSEAAELTKQIIGAKGLQNQLNQEKEKSRALEAVLKELKPRQAGKEIVTDLYRAEIIQLEQRQEQLLARLAELKKTRTVADRP